MNNCNYDYTKCNIINGYIGSIKIKYLLLIILFLIISFLMIYLKINGLFISMIIILIVYYYIDRKVTKMTYLTSKKPKKLNKLHKNINIMS